MNEFEFEVKEVKLNCGANIKVIGVGGCGSNMVNRMIKTSKYVSSIDMVVANTDIQDLEKSESEIKVQLGKNITGGRGAGARPEVGLASAQEAEEEIKKCLEGANLIFLATGLGGGTGTGAAPFIAAKAKEMGILVIGIATMPRPHERRTKKALKGLAEFKKECDSVILIHNAKLLEFVPKVSFREAFEVANEVLVDAVESMLTILLTPGDTNVDFADVQTIMTYRGLAQIGSGHARGENSVNEAFVAAFNSPLLDAAGRDLSRARGVIPFVRHGKGITFEEIETALTEHLEQFDEEEVECIQGYLEDHTLADDEVHVIIMCTGFDDEEAQEAEQESAQEAISGRVIRQEDLLRTASSDIDIDYKNINYREPAYKRIQQD